MSDATRTCFDRLLPGQAPTPVLRVGPNPEAVIFVGKLWPNGSRLKVRFLGGSRAQQELALAQAAWWSEHANLAFEPSDDPDAEIRVAFEPGDGAWSYLGTDCLSIPRDQPTMNLGFQDGGTSAHEFGHAIGLGHEHQNPQGGIEWNEAEVIRDLSGPPNSWDVDQIRHNVLEKYAHDQIRGTAFDPNSIMLYFFPARWTRGGVGTHANETLSDADRSFVAGIYPKDRRAEPRPIEVGSTPAAASIGRAGEEDLFAFTVSRPGAHLIETSGRSDLVMKLYGPDSRTALLAEDDDSGAGLNPKITRTLSPGSYLVQVRHYNREGGTGDYAIAVRR